MKHIVDKLRALEREISIEKGEFALFALFLREDAQDKWDLLASASWIERDKKDSLAYLADRLRSTLDTEELLSLSRIVFVEEGTPTMEALHGAIKVEHGIAEVQESNFFGLQIKHAYIITSKRASEIVDKQPT